MIATTLDLDLSMQSEYSFWENISSVCFLIYFSFYFRYLLKGWHASKGRRLSGPTIVLAASDG